MTSLLAHGLTELIASATCTIAASIDIENCSQWWFSIISIIFSGSLYFLANFHQISGWVHSYSWSIAFQISCNNHHTFTIFESTFNSLAIDSAIIAVSLECLSIFCQ